jgi:hypothetical protein
MGYILSMVSYVEPGSNNTTITNNNNNDNNKRWQSKIPNQHQQQEKDNKPKSIKDNLTLKLRQKQRDIEQLGIDPAEILEEEEKRQPLCQQE